MRDLEEKLKQGEFCDRCRHKSIFCVFRCVLYKKHFKKSKKEKAQLLKGDVKNE